MDNSKNYSYKTINDKNKITYQKRDHSMIITNKNNSILEQNNIINKTNYIIDNKKKILKRKLLIPNNKCQFKKTNKIPKKIQETASQKIILDKKISKRPSRRQSCGFINRNKNYQLYVSNSSSNSPKKVPDKNISIKKSKININNTNKEHIQTKKEKMNLISKSPKKISIKLKNNYYIKNASQNNFNNIGIKIINNEKKAECPLCVTKIDKRQNILNNNINNNNFNGNITYNNNVNLNFNDKDNIIYDIPNISNIPDIPKKIYINNREMNIIKKNFKQSNNNDINTSIIKRNKLIKIPIMKNDFSHIKKEFPNNYSYHEITHSNYPYKANKINVEREEYLKPINININEIKGDDHYNFGNKGIFAEEELYNENNTNVNKIAPNSSYLIHNQSFSHFNNRIPMYALINPNYSTIFNKRRQYFRNNILNNVNKDYNNTINEPLYKNRSFGNYKNIILSPKNKKLDYSDRYIEIEKEEIQEIPQKINFFGEEMLKRNKNYNFSKYEKENKNNCIPLSASAEKKFKNKKIRLNKKHFSYNNLININRRNNEIDINLKECLSYQKDEDKNKNNNKSPKKILNEINTSKKKVDFNSVNKIQKINRYSHNIINRKKIKKLVMEKSQNEEFISKSNKKENNASKLKGRINNYENSILDNDSINEIIQEFEKEIEDEEKREKDKKAKNKNKKGNKVSNNDSIKFSYISDNDFSFMSKDSMNNSRIKKKVHYYKTKNVDMEKNYDFVIYGTKKDKTNQNNS